MRKVAFITDIHLEEDYPIQYHVDAERNLRMVIEDLEREGIEEVVIGGDMGAPPSHEIFFEAFTPFKTEIILGNHDELATFNHRFEKGSDEKELYYAKEDAGFKYIYMDTSAEEVGTRQLEWLQQQLRTELPIVLFIHHPILPIDTPVDHLYPLANREEVRKQLVAIANEIFLFSGHIHLQDEQHIGNLHQYTTPAVSYQVVKSAKDFEVDSSFFGYRIITFDEGKVYTTVKILH